VENALEDVDISTPWDGREEIDPDKLTPVHEGFVAVFSGSVIRVMLCF
jgi:hypothetical protein